MPLNNFIALEQAIEREPLAVSPELPLEEVIDLMSQSWTNSCLLVGEDRVAEAKSIASVDYSCVLAIANSQLLGIFTERDLVRLISTGRSLNGKTLAEVMTKEVITLTSTESQDIFAALNLLREHKISHLPITDENHRLLGLITQGSLRQALQSLDLLKFRTVKEVMSRAIHAPPTVSVLEIAQLMADYQVSCIPIVETAKSLRPIGIITERDLVQFQLLELNLEEITAQAVMSTPLFLAKPEDSLWTVQQQMEQRLLRRLVVAGEQGELLGVITQSGLLRAINPIELRGSLDILQSRVRRLERERIEFLQRRNDYLANQIEQQTSELQDRVQREQLVATIALRIRQSLDLESILNTTVAEVRQLIEADRVLIYRFEPDRSGIVTKESVSESQWSIFHRVVKDSCFEQAWIEPYQQGHIFSVADVERTHLSQCHREFLASFQVKANIAIPILLRDENATADRLWGLLIVHQCSAPRNWQEWELELLQLLAIQVAIAIQQAELYQQAQSELARRRQAEETLQERETQLKTALDAAAMGTWSWNIATNEVILSASSQSILGFTDGEFPGTLEAIVDRIHPEDRNALNEKVTKAIDEGGLYEMETRIVLTDGKHRWLTARGHVLLDSEDRSTQMIGVTADITEKKQLEDKYLRQQRLESLGSLAGGIAHDLNNILTPIMMSVQILPITLPQIDSRSQELIQMLETNVKRGSALVKQVLSFARGIEGKRRIVQVKHLIADIRQIATETFPKSIEFQTDVSPNLWTVLGDATQIHQILLNLVINARDAMPDGGILDISAVNLTMDEEYVREHSQAQVGSYVAISITDTGIGISAENINQIFEPFFTTKENDGGTGLGLATVMTIVQSHGGFIDVVSEIGQGTRFNVFIPALEVSETDLAEHLAIPKGKGELILVVDDEATIREITRASLETHNYRVIIANNGIEAVASYVQNQAEIALVLMNMMMPEMDGTTAIRTLQKIAPNIKIIVMSGSNITYQTLSDRKLNISSFLAKPYSTYALLKAINNAVNAQ
ncbi:PAS domain S-box (modular protein) [Hyella patelloides LEGE 07179]|uniref:histidine kinase n=1 Tax=Hyella patelloides LEGE 07179 TaxID=945734 RepID=A0A563VUW4_9CYAN|nr:CBS domain-containing protein [Hyella patelloides]VEP15184.1 PAS domain S-box (modular protein) [Hyella patelloides LEGE 07179]